MTIILPERNAPRGKLLLPMRRREWLQPSQRRTTFGIEDETRFRISGRLHDGHIAWRGWFDDREDADAFLFAIITGSIRYERELWQLPTPHWHPDFGEELSYDLATVTFLTASTGSNQTYTSAGDWNNALNTVELIGAGGGGGNNNSNVFNGAGGGGGAFSGIANFTFASPGTTTATYQIGTGGPHDTVGGDSWFNAATLAASTVGAKGGGAGTSTAGTGGALAAGFGTTKTSGGNGSGTGAETPGGSGGGAGGALGNGKNGGTPSGNNSSSGPGGGAGNNGSNGANGSVGAGNGGAGGNNHLGAGGGAGGTGVSGAGSAGTAGGGGGGGAGNGAGNGAGAAGGPGTEWDATHGSGGGAGAAGGGTGGNFDGTNGGLYGAGASGASLLSASNKTGGTGAQGIIVLTYTPLSAMARSFGFIIGG